MQPTSAIVERSVELARIQALLKAGLEGQGGMVAIRGPAGIGKSALLAEARSMASEMGLRHRGAAADALTRSVPYAVARDLLAPALAPGSGWDAKAALADAGALAMPVLSLGAGQAGASPDAQGAALYGLTWLAINLAQQGPLLLTVDDAHVADAETLNWLGYLSTRLDEVPLVVLVATRPTADVPTLDALVGRLGDGGLVEPESLTPEAVGGLIRLRDASVTPDDVERFLELTGGVPFLIEALLRGMEEVGAAQILDGANSSGWLQQGVVSRIAATDPVALAVTHAIAILGSDAWPPEVAAVSGQSIPKVTEVVESLREARLLRDGLPFGFVHDLVAEAVLEGLGATRKSLLHVRAADELIAGGSPPIRVAAHLLRAGPTGNPSHIGALSSAAESALASGGPTTAAEYFRRLLQERLPAETRARVIHQLGRCEVQAMHPDAVEHLRAAVASPSRSAEFAAASQDLALALMIQGRMKEGYAALGEALEAIDPHAEGADSLRVDALAVALMNVCDDPTIRRLEADVEAHRSHDGSIIDRRAAGTLALAAFTRGGDVNACADLARYAMADDDVSTTSVREFEPTLIAAQLALRYCGFPDEARAVALRQQDWAAAHGAPALYFAAGFCSAESALYMGDLAAAELFGQDAQAAVRDGIVPALLAMTALPVHAAALVERGDAQAAAQLCADAGVLDLPAEYMLFSVSLMVRGQLRLALGEPEKALADLEACRRLQIQSGHFNTAGVVCQTHTVTALARLGRFEEALAISKEDVAGLREFGEPRSLGLALLSSGQVLQGKERADALEESVAVLETSRAKLAHARALAAWGAELRRTGHRSDARTTLRLARELATECAAAGVVATIDTELRACGARVVDRPVSGAGSLTASERRVAGLAAEGLTNAQIAQALFVSLKTVEMHLGRCYQKLGVARRDALATAMVEPEAAVS